MLLSARNKIPARVTGISFGEAIANVELEACGSRLVSSITVEAVKELGLAEGKEVTIVIKASDLILATED
jgi:molybdopterin-binding protein